MSNTITNHPIGCIACSAQCASVELAPDQEYKGDNYYGYLCEKCDELKKAESEETVTEESRGFFRRLLNSITG